MSVPPSEPRTPSGWRTARDSRSAEVEGTGDGVGLGVVVGPADGVGLGSGTGTGTGAGTLNTLGAPTAVQAPATRTQGK